MKSTINILIIVTVLIACSEKKVKKIPLIEGSVSNYAENEIMLCSDKQPKIVIDTIVINEEGFFSLSKQSINKPDFYFLEFKNVGRINLFLKPGDYINLQVDVNDIQSSCKSNNSKFLTALWALEKNTEDFKHELQELSDEFNSMTGEVYNDSLYHKLYAKKDRIKETYRKKSTQIANKVNSPIVDFVMLNSKAGNTSLFSLESDLQLFLNNAEALMNNDQTKTLFKEYDKTVMKAYGAIRSKQRFQKGAKFPELKARTNWNEKVTLEQVEGKPAHIILWSGVDMLDEAKIKQTKKLMLQHGSKGLKTIMIAYLKDKEAWLESIKKYRLPYWHLIDTMSVESKDLIEMGVRYLPSNFIVDSSGTIIARDVWDKALEQTIRSNIEK